jgi:hypothetical protein
MVISRVRVFFLASIWAVLAGCGASEAGPEQASPPAIREEAIDELPPPNGANGTRPSCFWAHGSQQSLRALGSAALDQGEGFLASISLSHVSQDCREVLRSAVECALTPAQSVSDPVTGELYRGWWGLAPSWLTSPLDVEGRRFVTACMVQRLNYSGTYVPILLEGNHPAIEQSPIYGPRYPIEESTVFGDLFSSTVPLLEGQPAFNVYVCWEGLLPQSCGPLELPLLFEKRICDDAPLCGLTTIGPCILSCERNGPYWECKPDLLAPAWTQTVRVKLETATCP